MVRATITYLMLLSASLSGMLACSRAGVPFVQEPRPEESEPTPAPSSPGENPQPGSQPDGATIIGSVRSSDGSPIAGAVVSDGESVTHTASDGSYRIVSDKSTGTVFVSVPGGYRPETRENLPAFFSRLVLAPDIPETHNFTLIPSDNNSFSVLVHADQHLARRTEDIEQFNRFVLPDMNTQIEKERSAGRQVYSLSLGDISWDQFWKANSFGLSDAVGCMKALDIPTWHTIGNHDNNPYAEGDWPSSAIFRETVAPNYYSFNIGSVHFVVLDNVVYNNPGATESQMGARSYDRALTDAQYKWLAADLAAVADKSAPLVVCAHVPFYSEPSLSGRTIVTRRNMLDMECFEKTLAGFSDVTLLSGHYHRNFTVNSPFVAGMREHNVASLSGSLWWTGRSGYSGCHLCTDGAPGGYGILRVDGREVDYVYKGIGIDEHVQFRIYDLNKTVIDEKCVTSSGKYKDLVKDYADVYYKPANDNGILVNVFSWQPGWTVEILENGSPLSVEQVCAKDPLHILSYECQRLSHNAVPTATVTFSTQYSIHFFKAKASRPDSDITVVVTDLKGRRSSKTIKRPYVFPADD